MIRWWRNSKVSRYVKYGAMILLPLMAFGFAVQVVVAGVRASAVDESKRPMGGNGQLMNDPNQEVSGGIANPGGVGGLGAPINGNGGVSGSVGRGSMAGMNSNSSAGVTFISSSGDQIVFNYFDILCTGKLSTEASAQLKKLAPSKGDTIKVVMMQKSVEDGLAASDGKTAEVGVVLKVETF